MNIEHLASFLDHETTETSPITGVAHTLVTMVALVCGYIVVTSVVLAAQVWLLAQTLKVVFCKKVAEKAMTKPIQATDETPDEMV